MQSPLYVKKFYLVYICSFWVLGDLPSLSFGNSMEILACQELIKICIPVHKRYSGQHEEPSLYKNTDDVNV